jgi:CRP/FNR family transcriptional regulator, cyclic AMP receptor protein
VSATGAPTSVRLALLLDYLMTTYGVPCADGMHIDVPLSQPELASLLGTSQPSLHRILTDLRRRDIVHTRYRRVIVRNPEALRLLAGG